MDLFLASLRHAFRGFLRTPGFTLAVLLTLGLGIGANTAMFSVTHALLLRPLPYAEPHRLVALWETLPKEGVFHNPLTASNFFDWRDEARSFEDMALYTDTTLDLVDQGEAESVEGLCVTSGYFELLRTRPLLGRTFTREDEAPHAQAVALISHGLWVRRFGGDPAVLGRTLMLSGTPTLLVGVLPPSFRAPTPDGQNLFTPFTREPSDKSQGMHAYQALARLRPGVSLAQARAELEQVAKALDQRHAETPRGWSATVLDLQRDLAGETVRPLLLLQGAVFLLLLIACANVANMLLVRGAVRLREMALRNALGATLRQHVVQHVAEGLSLGLIGGLLGLLLARIALRVMPVLWADTSALGALRSPELDGTVLAFTFVLTLAMGLAFSLVPVLQVRRGSLHPKLQRDAQGSPAMVRFRGLLILGEVALATVLLLGSGLLLRSFFKVAGTHPGFDPHQVIAFQLGLPESRYATDQDVRNFNRVLLQRLRSIPGVEGAGSSGFPPLRRNGWATRFQVGAASHPPSRWPDQADINLAGPGYLDTLKVPLLQGRDFSTAEGASPEVIVSRAFVRQYFPSGDALGKHLQLGLTSPSAPQGTLFEIVGVMGDHRTSTLEEAPVPALLASNHHLPTGGAWYVLRSKLPLSALAGPIRAQVAALDSQLAVRELTDLDTFLDQNLGDRRQPLLLLGAFSALALILAALGIHGVVAFSVAQRTREIGLRMALGADVVNILRMVFRQGMTPVLLGSGVGLAAFAALHRFLSSQLYGIQASDPLTLFLTLGLLSQAALLACLLPALRAARVQPAEALHQE